METQLQGILGISKDGACDASSSGIQIVEINTSIVVDNQTSVLDTGCGSHLVSSMKRLRSSRKVNKGDMDLRRNSCCSGCRTISFMFISIGINFGQLLYPEI